MPVNKQALIRYQTIDRCLQNRQRRWTLEDLMDACSDALYQYEGRNEGVSRRTVQLDIQNMRSDKLGYNAPIVVEDQKYYTYATPGYTIYRSDIGPQELDTLSDVAAVLDQFSGFDHFRELATLTERLRHKVYQHRQGGPRSYIHFEKNELLTGLEHLAPLHQLLRQQVPLAVVYQSFQARQAATMLVYPYLLKEYRNRWFLLCGTRQGRQLITLALDRIKSYEARPGEPFFDIQNYDLSRHYDDVIGVTRALNQRPAKVVLRAGPLDAPYILTKPLHPSQRVERREDSGAMIFSIQVVLNLELEREILGFGEGVEVLSPRILRKRMTDRLTRAAELYEKPNPEQQNSPGGSPG